MRGLVLIPTFNTGARLVTTVRDALGVWPDVWVVDDCCTDDSIAAIRELLPAHAGLRLISLRRNRGKGGAVLAGAQAALAEGFTHALVLDADGQHPIDRIRDFFAEAAAEPEALILGRPVFGPEAPLIRLKGRRISVALVRGEILGEGIDDPLFGFRVYPLASFVRVMNGTSFARRYDFDPEVAVRLVWAGVPTRNVPAACRYLSRDEGGVSHFHYFRDNVRMVWLHTRLITELLLWRWFALWRRRRSFSA